MEPAWWLEGRPPFWLKPLEESFLLVILMTSLSHYSSSKPSLVGVLWAEQERTDHGPLGKQLARPWKQRTVQRHSHGLSILASFTRSHSRTSQQVGRQGGLGSVRINRP
ncbi:uncharacterized protein LOC144577824 [Callithrix jacchus]